jgi:hypothetical protein
MKNEIIFYPKSDLTKQVIPPPIKSKAPDWYKGIPMYQKKSDELLEELVIKNRSANYSIKSCMPFLDSLTSGYTLNLWCDVQVKIEDGVTYIKWLNQNQELSPIESSPDPKVPSMPGFTPYIFSWISHWGIKTPRGYSCLFTHPLNRSDLPFHTTSGIIDTDKWGIWGTQPFALIEGWEGVIPAGTEVAQFFPFKREEWKSKVDKETKKGSLSEWANFEYQRHSSKFRGFYRSKYWQKKNYS